MLYLRMIARTHDVGAFGALLAVAIYYPPATLNITTAVAALIGNIVGALLPDIDQASNRLWDLLPGGNIIGKVLKRLFLSHRTLSHSLLGMWLVYKAVVWGVPKLFNANYVDSGVLIVAILVGYGSHLLLDSLTEEGLPLFFPFKFKIGIPPVRFLRIKSGGWVEKWLIFPLIVAGIGWLVVANWQRLVNLIW